VLEYQPILTRTSGEEAFCKCGQTDTSPDIKGRYKAGEPISDYAWLFAQLFQDL